MRFLYLSDWHIRSTMPLSRKDNYSAAQFDKIKQLIQWANKYDVPVFCAGDMLDSNRITFNTYNQLQRILKCAHYPIFVIRGNHDAYFHTSDVSGTPLQGLADANVITIPDGPIPLEKDIWLHAYGWDEDVGSSYEKGYNILMVHKAVFEKEIPFYFEGKEAYTPETLKETFPGYDLYLAGDIHIPFVKDNVVVSGSMMRMNTTQKDYRPRAYLIDTRQKTVDPLYFNIDDDVFHEELTVAKDTGYSETLSGLVEALKNSSNNPTDFKKDCMTLAEDPFVKLTLEEIFNHVEKD